MGEEDESVINILEKPYSVDDLVVPDEFNSIIAATLKEIDQLATRIDPNLYKTMTVFVDPIDGTREFATAQGEYVTILIGYNDGKRGVAVWRWSGVSTLRQYLVDVYSTGLVSRTGHARGTRSARYGKLPTAGT